MLIDADPGLLPDRRGLGARDGGPRRGARGLGRDARATPTAAARLLGFLGVEPVERRRAAVARRPARGGGTLLAALRERRRLGAPAVGRLLRPRLRLHGRGAHPARRPRGRARAARSGRRSTTAGATLALALAQPRELLLAEGRLEEALAAAEDLAERSGVIVNPGWAPWRSLTARALDGARAHRRRRSRWRARRSRTRGASARRASSGRALRVLGTLERERRRRPPARGRRAARALDGAARAARSRSLALGAALRRGRTPTRGARAAPARARAGRPLRRAAARRAGARRALRGRRPAAQHGARPAWSRSPRASAGSPSSRPRAAPTRRSRRRST